MTAVCLIVELTAQADKADQVADFFAKEFITRSRTEQGCTFYDLWRDTTDSNKFSVIEIWASQADLDTHIAQDWFAKYNPQLGAMLDGEPVVRVMGSVGA